MLRESQMIPTTLENLMAMSQDAAIALPSEEGTENLRCCQGCGDVKSNEELSRCKGCETVWYCRKVSFNAAVLLSSC